MPRHTSEAGAQSSGSLSAPATQEPPLHIIGNELMNRLTTISEQARDVAVQSTACRNGLMGDYTEEPMEAQRGNDIKEGPEPHGMNAIMHSYMELIEAALRQAQQELQKISQL